MSQINNMDTGDRATISMTDRWNKLEYGRDYCLYGKYCVGFHVLKGDAMDFLNSVLSWIRRYNLCGCKQVHPRRVALLVLPFSRRGDRAQQLTTYVLTEDAQSEMIGRSTPSFRFQPDESNFFPVTEDRGTGSIFDDKIGAMYLSLWMFTSYMVPILLSASAVT
ncbi:hypothetical protein BDQ17DRAFT_1322901 [Cyathus striatus]|nr:hypothetical protein BDQ17DRAFT_1322901 [Cyathus striatus]